VGLLAGHRLARSLVVGEHEPAVGGGPGERRPPDAHLVLLLILARGEPDPRGVCAGDDRIQPVPSGEVDDLAVVGGCLLRHVAASTAAAIRAQSPLPSTSRRVKEPPWGTPSISAAGPACCCRFPRCAGPPGTWGATRMPAAWRN